MRFGGVGVVEISRWREQMNQPKIIKLDEAKKHLGPPPKINWFCYYMEMDRPPMWFEIFTGLANWIGSWVITFCWLILFAIAGFTALSIVSLLYAVLK